MTQRPLRASPAVRVESRLASRSAVNTTSRQPTRTGMLSSLSRRGTGIVSRGLVPVHHRKMAAFSVKSLDHVVITAKDIPATIEFYTKRLGMKHQVFKSGGGERHALSFGDQKLNLHQSGKEFEPKAQHVQPGSEDLCFITDHPIDEVLESWQSNGVEVRLMRLWSVPAMLIRVRRSWKAAKS